MASGVMPPVMAGRSEYRRNSELRTRNSEPGTQLGSRKSELSVVFLKKIKFRGRKKYDTKKMTVASFFYRILQFMQLRTRLHVRSIHSTAAAQPKLEIAAVELLFVYSQPEDVAWTSKALKILASPRQGMNIISAE